MEIIFVKEKKGNTVNDVLLRILKYLELYVEEYHRMPDLVKLSKKDLQRIRDYNASLIDEENRILGMKITTFVERPIHNNKWRKYEFRKNR